MSGRSVAELREELARLMEEQLENLKDQTFLGVSEKAVQRQEEQLKRIREVSADFLAALKRETK
jgi:hypothetical protein